MIETPTLTMSLGFGQTLEIYLPAVKAADCKCNIQMGKDSPPRNYTDAVAFDAVMRGTMWCENCLVEIPLAEWEIDHLQKTARCKRCNKEEPPPVFCPTCNTASLEPVFKSESGDLQCQICKHVFQITTIKAEDMEGDTVSVLNKGIPDER